MVRRIFLLLLVTGMLFDCMGHEEVYRQRKAMKEGWPPEILGSYADEVIRPGETWKVYLRFIDRDCDMTYIVADLTQAGFGSYPVSFTQIKETGCQEVKGYIFLNTPLDQYLSWDQFELKVLIRDRRGNRSKPLFFPLSFGRSSEDNLPESWQVAAEKPLGPMRFDLMSSQRLQSGGS